MTCPKCGKICMECHVRGKEIRMLKKIIEELLYSTEYTRRSLWRENGDVTDKLFEAEEKIASLNKEPEA